MELGLSLGEASGPFGLAEKTTTRQTKHKQVLGFCMGLGVGGFSIVTGSGDQQNEDRSSEEEEEHHVQEEENGGRKTRRRRFLDGKADDEEEEEEEQQQQQEGHHHHQERRAVAVSADHHPVPVQLDLLPLDPVIPRNNPSSSGFTWLADHQHGNNSEAAACSGPLGLSARGFDVNRLPSADHEYQVDDAAAVSSPNSTISSFQIDFSMMYGGGSGGSKRDSEAAGLNEIETERASSRASDEDENGMTRKKLRLSKEQSAFLEESFKEHNTLNPKQKQALAKQLNLRPRQVEVWFQNRRARTKLKQTEVDCEYLKRCCETLTEENRRLQKELQELRALKTSHPYYMQLPATTLTMCPSCERVATNPTCSSADPTATITTTTTTSSSATTTRTSTTAFSFNNPRFYTFAQPNHLHQSAAS